MFTLQQFNRVVALIALMTSAALAQTTRAGRVVSDLDIDTWESATVTATGIFHYVNPVTDQLKAVTTGVAATGDIVVIKGGAGGAIEIHALIAGRNTAGLGIVEHWTRNESTGDFALTGSTTFLSDIVGVGYTAGYVYILEVASAAIWRKSWIPGGDISAGSWQPWVTTTHLPALVSVVTGELETASTVPGAVRYLTNSRAFQMGHPVPDYVITDVAGPVCSYNVQVVPSTGLMLGGASEAGTSVEVFAHSGDTVEVVDLASDTVLGSAISSSESSLTVSLSESLIIGNHYLVRRSGEPTNPVFGFPSVRRYGTGEAFPDGTVLRPIPPSSLIYVGSPDVAAFLPLKLSVDPRQQPPLEQAYTGYMAVALRGEAGDPVIPIGTTGEYLLDTPLLIPVAGYRSDLGQGFVSGSMEIPNDPSLAGQVLLIQFWLSDGGGNARVSQVVGQVIAGSSPTLLASGGNSLQGTSQLELGPQSATIRDRLFRDKRIQRVPGAAQAMLLDRLQNTK